MAKAKEKSRAEILAEQLKAGAVKRNPKRGPAYVFPDNRLQSIRDKLGLKQSVVGEETLVEPSVISAIETKGSDPRLSTAIRIAAFYGQSVEDLFGPAILKNTEEKQKVSWNETVTAVEGRQLFVDDEGEIRENSEAQKL